MDEVRRVAKFYGEGGKAYLPLYREGKTLYSSQFVADAFCVSRHQAGELCRQGRLDWRRVGYRLYITEESLLRLIQDDAWRNTNPLISDIILQKFNRGSEMPRAGPEIHTGGADISVPHKLGNRLDAGPP